jgi:hypothetical protein
LVGVRVFHCTLTSVIALMAPHRGYKIVCIV